MFNYRWRSNTYAHFAYNLKIRFLVQKNIPWGVNSNCAYNLIEFHNKGYMIIVSHNLNPLKRIITHKHQDPLRF